jgi:hypothetical protein
VKGAATNPNPLYLGAFDSAYYKTAGGTGNLYVCGNTGGNPRVYRVPITSGTLGTSALLFGLTELVSETPPCSPLTDVPNANSNPSKNELLFFSLQKDGIACANQGCLMNFVSAPWQPRTAYTVGQEILIQNATNKDLYIESAASTGTTGSSIPAWSGITGNKTTDGTVTWVNQGVTTVTPLSSWTASHTYPLQSRILDGNGNVEIVIVLGTSGTTAPTWNTTVGGNTQDPVGSLPGVGVTWVNAGRWPNASLTAAGGTGGIIIDNTSAFAGASQVYFFTLGNQTCTTSGGTGGCAMQASQSALH